MTTTAVLGPLTSRAPSPEKATRQAAAAAELAIDNARRGVQNLHQLTTSAIRALEDAELDSSKARLTGNSDLYVATAAEHLDRLQTHCSDMATVGREVTEHLARAGDLLQDATSSAAVLRRVDDPDLAQEAAHLGQRLAALGEVVQIAQPVAQLAARHARAAQHTSMEATAAAVLQPGTLEHTINTATRELGRADEDLRLLGTVVDRASVTARESVDAASELSDAGTRLTHKEAPPPGGPPASPAHVLGRGAAR